MMKKYIVNESSYNLILKMKTITIKNGPRNLQPNSFQD